MCIIEGPCTPAMSQCDLSDDCLRLGAKSVDFHDEDVSISMACTCSIAAMPPNVNAPHLFCCYYL